MVLLSIATVGMCFCVATERKNYRMEDEDHTDDNTGRDVTPYGYIMSPNYPGLYSSDMSVECVLEPESACGVRLTALDFHLEGWSIINT